MEIKTKQEFQQILIQNINDFIMNENIWIFIDNILNTTDKTILENIVKKIEEKYGTTDLKEIIKKK